MNLFGLSPSKFVTTVHELFTEARDSSRGWRHDAREDYQFYAGEQWSKEDKDYLEELKRPCVTFNRVQPVIEAVKGSELFNRQETRFLPRTLEDGSLTEMYTELARWVRDMCDADDEESRAFGDAAICGMGWTETWVDFEEDPDGQIRVERLSSLEMYWDSGATKQNIADSKWRARLRAVPRDELKRLFPDKRLQADNLFQDTAQEDPHRNVTGDQYAAEEGISGNRKGMVNVLQFQWVERKPFFLARHPESDELEELDEGQLSAVREKFPDLDAVRQSRKVFYQAMIAGRTLLSREVLHQSDRRIPGFTFCPITGRWDEEERQWFGLMRSMKDPQRWSNKFFSQIQDIVNANAKGGIIAEKGAFENPRKAEEAWSSPDRIVWLQDGALSQKRVEQRNPPSFPAALDRLLSLAISGVRETSGVSIEFLGIAERTQSGTVEASRVGQGMVILGTLFNALRRYRKEQGRVLLHLIRRYVPEGKAFRVTNNQAVKFMPVSDTVEFDVIVDQAPSSPNMKLEVWEGMKTVLPALLRAGLPFPMPLVKYLPLPDSVIQEIMQWAQSQGPDEEQQQLQKIAQRFEVEGLAADVAQKKASAVADIMKAGAAQQGVKTRLIETIINALVEEEKIDAEKGKVVADTAMRGLDNLVQMEKIESDERTKRSAGSDSSN